MTIELAFCESHLLREIADPDIKRIDVAKTYALTLKSSECGKVDWPKVNGAIMSRWSRSGLEWIKTQAWSGKCFREER